MVAVIVLAASAGGCATPQFSAPDYTPAMPPMPPPAPIDGAIFHDGHSSPLFADVKARRVGDLLTIVLVEQTNASKKASTSTSKETDVSAETPTLFGKPLTYSGGEGLLEMALSSEHEFEGEADSVQSNSLSGRVTVTVIQVLPNGNLVIRGEKRLVLNQGEEFVQISGIVRPVDIGTDNAVFSTQVADARITYSGRGALADANAMGWAARVLNSPWWPF